MALDVIYQDEALIVINKPAGLVVHPGAGNPSGTLQNALLARDPALAAVPRAGIVHRLDKDTTGLIVVARNLTAQQLLAGQIERREMHRIYRAVCQTVLTGGGVIDAPIDRHPRERTRMAVREPGRPARTLYSGPTGPTQLAHVGPFRGPGPGPLPAWTGPTHGLRGPARPKLQV